MFKTIFAFCVLLFFSIQASAQTAGAITGVVRDQAGAVIAGANVSVRSLETNLTRATVTDGEGRYVFPVPPEASVSRLALWVGDKLMEDEVVEKKRAASIFNAGRAARRR